MYLPKTRTLFVSLYVENTAGLPSFFLFSSRLYFSAHWFHHCRAFTPKLVSTYEKMKAAVKDMEIVFVSWDREKEKFDEYYQEMPWATFPFKDTRIEKLVSLFELDGIPALMTFKGSEVANKKARGAAQQDPNGVHGFLDASS